MFSVLYNHSLDNSHVLLTYISLISTLTDVTTEVQWGSICGTLCYTVESVAQLEMEVRIASSLASQKTDFYY